VRYTVFGAPVHVGRCHCADCRKESGSAFTWYAQWPVDAFDQSGELAEYEGRRFCPRCGSQVLTAFDEAFVEIALGTLDDAPSELGPEAEIWIKRRESWIAPVAGAVQFVENRS
jgi:hypothetical protein